MYLILWPRRSAASTFASLYVCRATSRRLLTPACSEVVVSFCQWYTDRSESKDTLTQYIRWFLRSSGLVWYVTCSFNVSSISCSIALWPAGPHNWQASVGQQTVYIGPGYTSRIVMRRLLWAVASALYIELIDDTYVLSMMTLLPDCSTYWKVRFVGARMSCDVSHCLVSAI